MALTLRVAQGYCSFYLTLTLNPCWHVHCEKHRGTRQDPGSQPEVWDAACAAVSTLSVDSLPAASPQPILARAALLRVKLT